MNKRIPSLLATSIIVTTVILTLSIGGRSEDAQSEEEEESTAVASEEAGEVRPSLNADYRKTGTTAAHKISRVTVYSDRAEVTRTAQVTLKAGKQWVHFASLPENLDRSTMRVQLAGSNGRIHQVVMEDAFEHMARPADLEKKLANLRSWYGELLGKMQQERATQEYLAFVQDLKYDAPFKREIASQAYRSFSAKVDNLKTSMDEIHAQSGKLSTKLHTVRKQMTDVKERVDHVLKEIQNATEASEQKWMLHLYAEVESHGAATVPIEATYQITNARWHPLYDVRAELDRNNGTAAIRLITTALVEQHTGEDWKGVKLTLSTLDPIPLYLPKLNRWILSEVRREERPQARAGDSRFSDTARSFKAKSTAPSALDSAVGSGGSSPDAGAPAAPVVTAQASNRAMQAKPRSEKRKQGAQVPRFNDAVGGSPVRAESMEADEAASADLDSSKDMEQEEGAALGKVSRSARSLFPMVPMEKLFPEISGATQQLSSLKTAKGEWKLYEVSEGDAAPQRTVYNDSTLPAVQAGGQLIEFTSPFPIDLKNDEPAIKTSVHSQLLKGALNYFSIPKKDTRVFLRAKTTNSTSLPILGGSAQVFMDGDLVSKTSLETLGPDAYFTVSLGTDRNVETKRIVKKNARKTGLLKKSHETDVGVSIELANHHPFAVRMEVKDHYPLSPGKDIEVELQKTSPNPVNGDDDNAGILTWEVTVPPKQKTTLSYSYRVTHPENYIVSEFE